MEVPSIKKIASLDSDDPAGVNYSVSGLFGMGYCGEILLAQTWNIDLAYKMGDGICQEFEDFQLNGWYAPSMNLHRSLFAGRNFEYYSEDSMLSGQMAIQECEAAYAHGVYPYIKHFAFNEQETNRNGMLCTWLTEQSARELYLKPFEDCVKANQGQALAVMSSYVYVGTTWDGGCSALLNDILTDQTSATSVLAMRQAAKNILYTVVNSATYNQENYEAALATPNWIKTTYMVDAALVAVLIIAEVLIIRGSRKKEH